MTPEIPVPALAVAVPALGAVLIAAAGSRPNLRETATLVTAGLLFALVASLLPAVAAGARPEATLVDMMPGLAIAFRAEPLGVTFAAVSSFLWIVTSIYSIGYMRAHGERNQTRFYTYFAIAMASTMGVAFAANLLTLFVFYEILTLSTYPLVTHAGTEEAKRGGRVYLALLLVTSLAFLLPAVVWTWVLSGTLDFADGGVLGDKAGPGIVSALLLLYVFGIGKAALMPFHRWLPAAMVAPTPVSALLHAVAVVKAGVFTILKVVVYVFGLDLVQEAAAGHWLRYAAAATILLASIIALTQDNLKLRLAYSTVSQLSYVVLGAMLANAWGIVGGGLHIAMHAFGKITLFFCAGAIAIAAHRTRVSELAGLGRAMPITFGAFLVGALSVIGLPPMGGLWSKWYLALATLDAGELTLLAVLMASSLLNVAYLVQIPVLGFFVRGEDAGHASVREAPVPCLIAMVATSAGCLALFLYPDPVHDLLSRIVSF